MSVIDIPDGQLASIVTYLEMTDRPLLDHKQSPLYLEEWPAADPQEYLSMFRAVGENWLWLSRLLWDEARLRKTLHSADVSLFKVVHDEKPVGFIELDFSQAAQCEISFFGLIPEMNGQGHGRWMMTETLKKAWKPSVRRVWLHTCTLDAPNALGFYQRSGFHAYRREIEILPDPRITGHLPRSAAPHIPVLS